MKPLAINSQTGDLVGFIEGTMIGAGEHCFRAARDLGLTPVFFSTEPDRYIFLSNYECIVVRVASIDVATLTDHIRLLERETQRVFVGFGTTDDTALSAVRELSFRRGFASVPERGLLNCRNKAFTRELLRHQSPKFERVAADADFDDILTRFQSDVIVKPVDQSSGLGVKRCRSRKEAKKHIQSLLSDKCGTDHQPTCQVLVEEYLDGQEVSVEVFNGRALGVTQIEIDDARGFVEASHLYPANLQPSTIARLKVMAEEAVAVTGLKWGPAHIQYRLVKARPYLIEINPRLGGGNVTQCVEYASGVRLAHAYVRLICNIFGVDSELEPSFEKHACVRFVLTKDSRPVSEVAGLDQAAREFGIVETGTRARTGCSYPVRGSNHDRLAFAIAAADQAENAIMQARAAAKAIEIRALTREKA